MLCAPVEFLYSGEATNSDPKVNKCISMTEQYIYLQSEKHVCR